jgi:hypothetical protein
MVAWKSITTAKILPHYRAPALPALGRRHTWRAVPGRFILPDGGRNMNVTVQPRYGFQYIMGKVNRQLAIITKVVQENIPRYNAISRIREDGLVD